jgi:pyruvate dehydrogenase E2 component (dihydrolipoamide acetyltransferase)
MHKAQRRSSFPFSTKRVRIRDGEVAYFDCGEGPPILFVHGLVGDFTHFEHIASRLASTGHRVVAMDLPGCGASHKKRRRYDLEGYAKDVLDVMDALELDRLTLAGHSAGGAVVAEAALRAQHRVDSLVLISSAGLRSYGSAAHVAVKTFLRPWVLERSLEHLAMPLLDLVLVERNAYTQKFVRDALDRPKFPTLREMARVMSDFVPDLVRPTVLDRAEAFSMPVLVVWGDADKLVPPESASQLSQRLPDVTLRLLSSCGHMPMIERPETVAREIAAFVSGPRPGLARPQDVHRRASRAA